MSNADSLELTVAVEVDLPTRLSNKDTNRFETAVQNYLERLCSELGLDLKPVLQVKANPEGEGSPAIQIKIDGQPCRQPRRAAYPNPLELPDLCEQVCEILLLNRSLLVTGELAAGIHKRRFYQTEFSARQVAEMAVEVVCLGFSLEKLTALTLLPQPMLEAGPGAADFIETALDGFDTCEIKVRLGQGLSDLSGELTERLQALRDEAFKGMGVLLPPISVETVSELPAQAYQYSLNGLYYPPYPAFPHSTGENDGESLLERCLAGLPTALQRNAGAFINRSLVEYLLANLGANQPELVKAASARWQIQDLTRILRRLVEEFSIRDLASVLTAIVFAPNPVTVDPTAAVLLFPEPSQGVPQLDPNLPGARPLDGVISGVRANLRFQIWKTYAPVYQVLAFVELDEVSLGLLARAARAELSPPEKETLLQSIYRQLEQVDPDQVPVVLVSMPLRALLRRLTEIELPDVPVLSYQDLPSFIIAGGGRVG